MSVTRIQKGQIVAEQIARQVQEHNVTIVVTPLESKGRHTTAAYTVGFSKMGLKDFICFLSPTLTFTTVKDIVEGVLKGTVVLAEGSQVNLATKGAPIQLGSFKAANPDIGNSWCWQARRYNLEHDIPDTGFYVFDGYETDYPDIQYFKQIALSGVQHEH